MRSTTFSRDELLALLREVGQIISEQGLEASLYVVGGAAMSLVFDARRTTRDVDASFRDQPDALRDAACDVARRRGLPADWLNTAASAFMTNEPDHEAIELTVPGLRITVASAEHLIAMKLRAMRPRDLDDLEALFRHAGVSTPLEAAQIHDRLFDDSYIGQMPRGKALFAAQLVFDRAAAKGRPIADGTINS